MTGPGERPPVVRLDLSAPREPERAPRPRTPRPRLRTALLVLAAFAAGAGVSELRQAQADRAERARLDAVVDLQVTSRPDDLFLEPGRVAVQVVVANGGPRPVALLAAASPTGDLAWEGGDRELGPGESTTVRLAGRYGCSVDGSTFDVEDADVLELTVRTGAGERTTSQPLRLGGAAFQSSLDRLCGVVPPGEAVLAYGDGTRSTDTGFEVDVLIDVQSRVDQRVLGVEAPEGVGAVLLEDGAPVPLPLALEGVPPEGRDPSTFAAPRYVLAVDYPQDCEALRELLLGQSLVLRFDAGEGSQAQWVQVFLDVTSLPDPDDLCDA